jgi:hypothetical protein
MSSLEFPRHENQHFPKYFGVRAGEHRHRHLYMPLDIPPYYVFLVDTDRRPLTIVSWIVINDGSNGILSFLRPDRAVC